MHILILYGMIFSSHVFKSVKDIDKGREPV